jgi:geranylgeranyl diphosphate synthase type II
MAGATAPEIEKLTKFAYNIGLAFQIIDDILDITATQAELGKTAGKDLEAQKATYPKLWGLAESKRQADKLVAEAKAILAEFGDRARPLQALADYITDRKN